MPQTAAAPESTTQESIAARHARLYARRSTHRGNKHSTLDSFGWVAASVLIIGALLGSLWLVAG